MSEKTGNNINGNQHTVYKTCIVYIGGVPLGGDHPVRIQSMTNTNTLDTKATTDQVVRIINAGADYVRISVPGIKEAENLRNIKKELRNKGYATPLIADIHFNPKIAEIAAAIAEKIRINPGNLFDGKRISNTKYSAKEYADEIKKIRNPFVSLLHLCKKNNTAIRIGVNHGSLSDRILNRYGDTIEGMAESALEFMRICKEENFRNVVVSLKANNTRIMINANRFLVKKMIAEEMYYPVHLGVTEAGEGEDGRLRSAVGIGALLEEGIGDTIRVSLTEDPEAEIPFAKKLVQYYEKRGSKSPGIIKNSQEITYTYKKRNTSEAINIGGGNMPVVISDLSHIKIIDNNTLVNTGYSYNKKLNKWEKESTAPDHIYTGDNRSGINYPDSLGVISDINSYEPGSDHYPLISINDYLRGEVTSPKLNFLELSCSDLNTEIIKKLKKETNIVLILNITDDRCVKDTRSFFDLLEKQKCKTPVIFRFSFSDKIAEDLMIKSACMAGPLFADGYGDGIWISDKNIETKSLNSLSFNILQACRARFSKTEFISCPTCARSQFDVQDITKDIKKHASLLPGLKIAVMGCIVNGPGEMADADYGYVGSGRNKVTIYKGQKIIKKNINSETAIDELLNIIRVCL